MATCKQGIRTDELKKMDASSLALIPQKFKQVFSAIASTFLKSFDLNASPTLLQFFSYTTTFIVDLLKIIYSLFFRDFLDVLERF